MKIERDKALASKFRNYIRFPLIILLLVGIFGSSKPEKEDLIMINDAKITKKPKLKKRKKRASRIEFKIDELWRTVEIDGHDFEYCQSEKILSDLHRGDRVTIGRLGNNVYYLYANGIKYTNLQMANEGRRQVQLWVIIFSIVAILLTIIPAEVTQKLKVDYTIIVIITLIATALLLYYFLGVEHLF